MHWILQENIFNEDGFNRLLETLERFNLPYSTHKVIPFIGELLPEPQPTMNNVICFGSYSMRHAAKKYGWMPGVFDLEAETFARQMHHWGEHMLNADSQVVRFAEAKLLRQSFLRPIDDSKHFAGGVYEADEFHDWQHKVVALGEDTGSSLTGDTLIQVSTIKKIYTEYRYWIVDGQVVTASLYKRGQRVIYEPMRTIDNHVHRYVDLILRTSHDGVDDTLSMRPKGYPGYRPARAFVLDVCETSEGMRVVEINTMNAAGFYAADMSSLVMALEGMKHD